MAFQRQSLQLALLVMDLVSASQPPLFPQDLAFINYVIAETIKLLFQDLMQGGNASITDVCVCIHVCVCSCGYSLVPRPSFL